MTVKRGFGLLPCPRCGAETTMSLDLDDMAGNEAVQCRECDAQFGLDEMRSLIEKWQRVIAWVDSAPTLED